jgi:SPP1 gp7 family putative phage head morphogenesis protein
MASRRRRRPAQPRGGPNADERILNETIKQSVLLERVKATLAAEAGKPWIDAGSELAASIIAQIEIIEAAGASLTSLDVLTVLQREVQLRAAEITADAAERMERIITEGMVRISQIEATWLVRTSELALPPSISLDVPPLDQLRAWTDSARWRKFGGDTQRPLVQWSKGLQTEVRANVRKVVREALQTGSPVPEVRRRIQEVTKQTARQAEAVARTGFSHATSVADQTVAEANDDVIIGVMWLSTLDSRTTMTCASLDRTVYRTDEGPRPPAHFNCRSRVTMLTRDITDIAQGKTGKPTKAELEAAGERRTQGKRDGIDYQQGRARPFDAGTSYGDWLKRQPAAVQDEVLGRKRGKLFREGKVQIEQFVGSDYQPLTLKELETKLGLDLDI